MPAYLVLMQEIHDMDRYRNEYLPAVGPFLQKYGAEVLVAGSDAEHAEGEPPNSTVVIRFADTEAAWRFLNDPDYQPRVIHKVQGQFPALVTDPWRRGGQCGCMVISHRRRPLLSC